MLAKILIVEDEIAAAEMLELSLKQASYDARIAIDGADGLRQAYAWRPDLILLDIMMPNLSGWTVCERLRQISDVPIIFLTVLDQEKHVIQGLEMGADDYITKPYNRQELLARVEAILRRQARQISRLSDIFVYDDLRIDFGRAKVTRGDQAITLTSLEFKLLACLAEHPGKSLSHDYLTHRVWGDDHQSRSSLKLYIWYLRQKLERDPTHPKIILTDHGVGYRLSHPQ